MRPARCTVAVGGPCSTPWTSQIRSGPAPADGFAASRSWAISCAVWRSSFVWTPCAGEDPDRRQGAGWHARARRLRDRRRVADDASPPPRRRPPQSRRRRRAVGRVAQGRAAAAAARGRRRRATRAARPSPRTRSSSVRSAPPRAVRARSRRRAGPLGERGAVFGSVIMKKRNTSTSGEVTSTHHSWKPEIGPRCQRAVIVWPARASTPIAAANVTQKPSATRSSFSRRRMANPPATMIASASASQTDIGPHQKSSGAARSGRAGGSRGRGRCWTD